MPFTLMAPKLPPPKPGSPEAKLKTKQKRYHRKTTNKRKSTAQSKVEHSDFSQRLRGFFWKPHYGKRNGRYDFWKVDKKKIRGAKKKEAARLYKLEFPKGRPMASKPAPDYPGIITPKVLVRYMGLTPRYARRYLTQIKISIGKEKDHLLTVEEFCKKKNISIESIIPYLK